MSPADKLAAWSLALDYLRVLLAPPVTVPAAVAFVAWAVTRRPASSRCRVCREILEPEEMAAPRPGQVLGEPRHWFPGPQPTPKEPPHAHP
jgi:hypothetical protein